MISFLGLSPALDVTYLLDAFAVGEIHRPRERIALPGGKSLNAARAAALLGARTRAIAPLGGFTGARLRETMRGADGDRLDLVAVETTAETRTCVTVVDAEGATTEIYESPPALEEGAWSAIGDTVRSVDSGWVALSGSVPAGDEGRIAGLLASAPGARVAVDTHGDALAVLLDRVEPALVKVNRREACDLLGEGDAASLARTLSARTKGIAVVTDGADGAVAAHDGAAWRARPPRGGRYAVGSGDSFLAGLLVALEDTASLPDALTLATAAAVANTFTPGAARFDPAQVPALRAAVAVDRLA